MVDKNLLKNIIKLLFDNYIFNAFYNIDFEKKDDLNKIKPEHVSCVQLIFNRNLLGIIFLDNNDLFFLKKDNENIIYQKLDIDLNYKINLIDKNYINLILNSNNIKFSNYRINIVNNPDINILKYFKYNFDLKLLKENISKKVIYYNINHSNYYDDLFNINNLYYFGSFDTNDLGLQNSQLKTFVNIIDFLKHPSDKYFCINGGPGTGKSTILNYIISNILISKFIIQITNIESPFEYLISDKYEIPRILLTGSTKESVNNISSVCSLDISNKYKNNSNNLISWLSKIDYSFVNNENNDESKTNEDEIKLEDYTSLQQSLIEYLNKKYNINFASDPKKMINWLTNKIKVKNDLINNLLLKLTNILKTKNKNCENNLFIDQLKEFYKIKNCFKFKKQIRHFLINMKENSTILNDLFLPLNKIIQGKSYYFKPSWVIKRKIQKDLINKLIKEQENWTINLSFILDFIKKTEIDDFNEYKDKNIDFILSSNDDLELLSFIKKLEMNFHNIQRYIDTNLRNMNTIMYREIHELLFFYTKNRKLINPIISGNIQGINSYKLKKMYEPKESEFDLTIVDEAGQMNSKYILFLNQLSKKIIAVGDSNQLNPIIENEEINKRIVSLQSLNNINPSNLINYFKTNFYNNGTISSLLEWINFKCNIISYFSDEINGFESKKGSFLLEHFRCPKLIFDKVNQCFYDNIMSFKGNENSCNNIINNKYECFNNVHLIIKYKSDTNEQCTKNNIQEIKIFKNFVINNIDWILSHNNKKLDPNEYVSKNIAFVSLYRDQYKRIKEELANFTVRNINFKNIKVGTIDSLQGIGCDFVFFSNVTSELETKKDSNSYNWKYEFEFNKNRINVLYTRTKKHFIQIINENYYNNIHDNEYYWRKNLESENVTIINDVNYKIPIIFKSSPITKKQIKIGLEGEGLFDQLLHNPLIKYLLIKRIKKQIDVDIKYTDQWDWPNRNGESYKPYDFHFFNKKKEHFIDVKSTSLSNDNNYVYMSKKELEFSKKVNYLIARISHVSRIIYLKDLDLCSLGFLLKNIEFFKNNVSKNEFTNNSNQLITIIREND